MPGTWGTGAGRSPGWPLSRRALWVHVSPSPGFIFISMILYLEGQEGK